MNKVKTYITNSSEETQKLAEKMGEKLNGGQFFALFGNLGGGKTNFTQGLAKGLGIKRRIISPTFIILRQYKLKKGNFYHIDLYRTESLNDLINLGIDEIISDKNNIVVVEWAEKMKELLPKKRISISFKFLEENKREIKIEEYE